MRAFLGTGGVSIGLAAAVLGAVTIALGLRRDPARGRVGGDVTDGEHSELHLDHSLW